jgi:hypothetical protein
VPYKPKFDDHVLVSTHAHLFDHLLRLTKIHANPNRLYELSSVLTTQNTPDLAMRWSMFFPAYTICDTIEIEQSNPMVRLLDVMKRVMLKNQVDVVYDVEVEVGEKILRYGGAEAGVARTLKVIGNRNDDVSDLCGRSFMASRELRGRSCFRFIVAPLWYASRNRTFGR